MRSTLIAQCMDCKAARCRMSSSGSRVQVTDTPARRGAGDLNGETRARYDIDPGDTIEAIACALILAPLSVALVAIGALVRMVAR